MKGMVLAFSFLVVVGGRALAVEMPPPRPDAPGKPAEPEGGKEGGGAQEEKARIRGRVVFEGDPPKRTKIRYGEKCKEDILESSFLLNPSNHGLKNVFVWLKSGVKGKFPPPAEAAKLESKDCLFQPRVLGVVAGQKIVYENRDKTGHSLYHDTSLNPAFHPGVMPGETYSFEFTNAELMVNLHDLVSGSDSAWIHAANHPFFAITDEDGNFSIPVPGPGEYEVEALHEMVKAPRPQKVTVKGGEAKPAELEFKFQRKAKPRG